MSNYCRSLETNSNKILCWWLWKLDHRRRYDINQCFYWLIIIINVKVILADSKLEVDLLALNDLTDLSICLAHFSWRKSCLIAFLDDQRKRLKLIIIWCTLEVNLVGPDTGIILVDKILVDRVVRLGKRLSKSILNFSRTLLKYPLNFSLSLICMCLLYSLQRNYLKVRIIIDSLIQKCAIPIEELVSKIKTYLIALLFTHFFAKRPLFYEVCDISLSV